MDFSWAQEAAKGVADYMADIATNPANYPILVVVWVLIQRLDPVFRAIIAHPYWTPATRVALHQLIQKGKATAATWWCLLLVNVPHAQPPLCGDIVTDACQTIIERLAVAGTLGTALSFGHFATSWTYRKATGQTKRVGIVCASCKSKVFVENLSDACPVCRNIPHEVTQR